MNIRIAKIIFLSSIFIFCLQFAYMQTSPIAPDIQRIKTRGILIVALHSVDQPPFFFINKKNELTGLDIEISKGIADGLGVKLEFNRKAKSFNDLIDIVDKGEADIAVSKLSRTLSRAQIIGFSTPYITFRQALLLNRLELAKKAPSNEDIVPFIKDFTGKIGVIANSSYVNYAKKNFPRATVVEFPTWDDIVQAVFKGEILAGYRDEMEIKKIIKGRSDASLKVKSVIIKDMTDPISIAVSRKDTQLLNWINLHLENLNLNLDAEKLLNKYPEIFEQKK
jgi:ABC-type amino acid transport substrate-binding protein